MAEIEKILAKPFDELTMGEAIVIALAYSKEEGFKRIDYINKKEKKKSMHLGLVKE